MGVVIISTVEGTVPVPHLLALKGSGMSEKSESGMNNPYHISEILEHTKILSCGSGMKKFGSGMGKNTDPG